MRVHNADEIMAEIVAKRLVEHLARAGFVVTKRPPRVSGAAAFTTDGVPKAAVQYSMDEHVERDL